MSNNTPTDQMMKKKPSQEQFAWADSGTRELNMDGLGRSSPDGNEQWHADVGGSAFLIFVPPHN